jgi:hypothetical protein
MQRVARGELSEQQVREEFLRFAAEAGTRYATDLAQLSVSYYTALLDLGRVYNERFYDQVLPGHSYPTPPANEPAARAPRQVELPLRGPLGHEAAAGFVIENKHSTPADITFVFMDFVEAASGRRFRPLLQLQPAQLTLGPDEEAEIRLRVPLVPDQFAAGHHYHSKIAVHGYDALELVLNLTVDPAPEPATRVAAVQSSTTATPAGERPAPSKRARTKKPTGSKPNRRTK